MMINDKPTQKARNIKRRKERIWCFAAARSPSPPTMAPMAMALLTSTPLLLPPPPPPPPPPSTSVAKSSSCCDYRRPLIVRCCSLTPIHVPLLTTRFRRHRVRMAPEEEKMTRRSPLDFPIEWERPKPGRRPDIFPQFSPMKTPLPPPLPADPPEEDEEEEEKKEEQPEEDPEKEETEKPEQQ